MKAQQLVQCMVPRALFGGVRNTSKSVYSSDSQLLLSRPSVSGADLKTSTRVSVLLFPVRSSCFYIVRRGVRVWLYNYMIDTIVRGCGWVCSSIYWYLLAAFLYNVLSVAFMSPLMVQNPEKGVQNVPRRIILI